MAMARMAVIIHRNRKASVEDLIESRLPVEGADIKYNVVEMKIIRKI